MAKLSCANHPERAAGFYCRPCDLLLCLDCAAHNWTAAGFVDQCGTCQALLEPVAGGAGAADRGPAAFFARLPRFLMFPVHRSVLFMLLGLSLIAAPLYWAAGHNIGFGLGLVGYVLVKGLEISVYFRFISSTVDGKEDVDPPDFSDIYEDLIAPIVRYLGALLPIIAGVFWFGSQIDSALAGMRAFEAAPWEVLAFPAPALLILIGVALLPLLTIIAAVSRSFFAVLNPAIWLHSLRIMGATYLAAAVVFYAVLAVEVLLWVPLLLYVRAEHSIPIVTALITVSLAYLPMALRARILGGLVEPYIEELG